MHSGFYSKPIYTLWNVDFQSALPGVAPLPHGFGFSRASGATTRTGLSTAFTSQWKNYPYTMQTVISSSHWGIATSVAFANTTKVTVCGWIKLENNANAAVVYEGGAVWTAGGIGLFQNGNVNAGQQSSIYITHADGVNLFGAYTANQPTGVWLRFCHTIDCTLGANQGALYLNGVVQGLTYANNQVVTGIPTKDLNFFMRNSGASFPFGGNAVIDFIKIGKAYTATEAALDYQYGNGIVSDGTVLAKWDFNEGSGATINDRSGNAFNITLHNTPIWSTDIPPVTGGFDLNIPRLSFNGAQKGFEFEESRTSLVTGSRAAQNIPPWTIGHVAGTGNYIAGPDGVTTAYRANPGSGQVSDFQTITAVSGTTYAVSLWMRYSQPAGTGDIQFNINDGATVTMSPVLAKLAADQTWLYYSGSITPINTSLLPITQEGRDVSSFTNGQTARAHDAAVDMIQIEAGKFPTSHIITSASAVTRAGERLYRLTGSDSVHNGTLNLEVDLYPKGSSTQYSSPMRIWGDSVNPNSYVEVSNTNGAVTASYNNAIVTFPAALSWNPYDRLRLLVSMGSGSATNLYTRVGNASGKVFSAFPYPPVLIVSSSEILCSGTNQQFTSYVSSIAAYKQNQLPGWAASAAAWSPTDLGSSVKAWYKADTGTTIATGVSQWNDQSGNGNHLVQATGVKQPTLVSNAINGHSAIRFDGVNDFMQTSFTLVQPEVVFIVYKQLTLGAFATNDCVFDGLTSDTMGLFTDNSPQTYLYAGAGTATTATSTSVYSYTVATFNGVNSNLRTNGVSLLTADAGASNGNGFTIGSQADGSRNTNIEVAEIVILNALPTSDQVTLLENYFRAKYGLPAWIPGIQAWYRSDLGISIGTGVSQWSDLSGHGRHLIQATAGAQPTVVTSSLGYPAVRFDGVDDYMSSSFLLIQPETVYIVYKLLSLTGSGTGATNYIFDGINGNSMAFFEYTGPAATGIYDGTIITAPTNVASGSYAFATVTFNGASSAIRSNGVVILTGNAGNTANASGFVLGSYGGFLVNHFSNIEVVEVMVVNTSSIAVDTTKIENYFRVRYKL